MKSKIPYLNWRNDIEEITSPDMRIADDLLLIEKKEDSMPPDLKIFKTDVCFILFHEKGTSKFKINNKEYIIEAPCAVVVMPDQIYEPVWHSSDSDYKSIIESRKFCDSLFSSYNETVSLSESISNNPILATKDDFFVFEMYFKLLKDMICTQRIETRNKFKSAVHLTLSLFYAYAYAKHEAVEIAPKSRKGEIYNAFLKLLEDKHKEQRSIAFYADKLCVTPKYLSVVTNEIAGKNALKCIEESVVREAKALLNSTDMTIQQISDELNFPSQASFGTYFKKSVGLSPMAYRKTVLM